MSSSNYTVSFSGIRDNWGYGTHNNSGYVVSNCIAIGTAVTTESGNCIATGYNSVAKENYEDTQIGCRDFTDNEIWLSNIDIRELVSRVEQLEGIIEKQSDLINKLWYAPGMPGYEEGKDMWDNDTGNA